MASSFFLVAVQIIDINGVIVLEAENHAPVRPYGHGSKPREFAFEPVEPETGQVHILRRGGRIQPGENIPDRVPVLGADTAFIAAFEKPLQRPALETPDHG